MTKRDDESPTDMEVGMTTAERRRRRRRGAGLRVPSDNVPRRSNTPPVVAPVPEDPALAMSIAYSFASEPSEPVARASREALTNFEDDEDLPAVIDPVSGPIEQADFEIHTREMIAVDAESLEEQPAGSSSAGPPVQRIPPPRSEPTKATAPGSRVDVRFTRRDNTDPSDDAWLEIDATDGELDPGATLDRTQNTRDDGDVPEVEIDSFESTGVHAIPARPGAPARAAADASLPRPVEPSARLSAGDLAHGRSPGDGPPARTTPESLPPSPPPPPWPALDGLPPSRLAPDVPPLRSVLEGVPPAPRPVPEGSAPRLAPEGSPMRPAPESLAHRPIPEGLTPLRPLPEGLARAGADGLPRPALDSPPPRSGSESVPLPRLQVEGPPPPPRSAAFELPQARPPATETTQARPPLTEGVPPRSAPDSTSPRLVADLASTPRPGPDSASPRLPAVEVSQPRPPLSSVLAGPVAPQQAPLPSAPAGGMPPQGPAAPIAGLPTSAPSPSAVPSSTLPAPLSPTSTPSGAPSVSTAAPVGYRTGRAQTVALSEDDLEEVREAARLGTQPPRRPASPSIPPPMPPAKRVITPRVTQPTSVPEIDLQSLEDRGAESSGEFEVDVDGIVESRFEAARGERSLAEAAPAESPAADPRARTVSLPPASALGAPAGAPAVALRESQQMLIQGPMTRDPHAPPPPPAGHKAPPSPPPGKKDRPAPASVAPAPVTPATAAPAARPEPRPEGKPARSKPWFIELFDEDYLRTLPFLTPQATQAEAEFVIDALGLTPGAQVLDVGCGYGRHAMELAARGFHVVGLDLSTPLLVRGGEEAHRRGLTINFVRGDMRELDFDAQFDGAYCLFSTFGYFDDETNKKTAANIARALRPGGRVLIEILNRDYVIADLPTRVWWEGDGCVVLEEVELNYFSSRIQVNRSVVFDDGRQLEQEISVRAYSLHEIGKLMHSAGLRVLEVSGAYHTRGRFFGNQSRHIIVLAERKDASSIHPGST